MSFNLRTRKKNIILILITIILGILSLITIVEISYLEIDYDGED